MFTYHRPDNSSHDESAATAVLQDSMEDLSIIVKHYRKQLLCRIADKLGMSQKGLTDKYGSRPIEIPIAKSLMIPGISHTEKSDTDIYTPIKDTPTVKTQNKSSCPSKFEYFRKEHDIPELTNLSSWNPDTHCHHRTKLGFCLRSHIKKEDYKLSESYMPLCKHCLNVYIKHSKGIQSSRGGWRGLVTKPFTREINEGAYDHLSKHADTDLLKTAEGTKVRCTWKYTKYYRSFWNEEIGMVYYDDRTGFATKQLICDWVRGNITEQTDPIASKEDDGVIDMTDVLKKLGWTPQI